MYATAQHTYLATQEWQNWAVMAPNTREAARRAGRTDIHLFDTAGRGEPRYVASGQVDGFLLNQFAMDEDGGVLRVASTDRPSWWGWGGLMAADGVEGAPAPDSAVQSGSAPLAQLPTQSRVSVLRQSGTTLRQVGVVSGLGKGEQIRAVRFAGPLGYVVTFRQTDPLYTVDLRDVEHPRVTGELKLLGYSAYLHPVGDGLLLGVGQDATAQGQTLGLQMSLFDVTDPGSPRLLDTVALPGAWSDVEGDHHAFTFADGLALVPFSGSVVPVAPLPPVEAKPPVAPSATVVPDSSDSSGSPGAVAGSSGSAGSGGTGVTAPDAAFEPTFDAGVVAVRVEGRSLSRATVLRPVVAAVPQRTFVGDGTIWTVATTGIAAHDESTLRRIGFTAVPAQ
jgi:hypothetical protein